MKYSFLTFIVGVALLFFSLQHTYFPRPEKNELIVPPKNTKYFTFGYQEVVADSMWLRVIQDFDTCGKALATDVSPVPSGPEAVEKARSQRVGRCENSWVYNMIDAITELAPRFQVPYSQGGVILSVAVDDVSGAGRIYEKGISQFPNEWQIAYKAAYHYLYEIGDRKKAADLLMTASKLPQAPYWLPILAARLYSKTGSAMLGKAVLEDFIEKNPDQADNEHVKKRMAEIERDLAAGDDPEPQTGAATALAPTTQAGAAQKPAVKPTALPKKKQ
jgi:hypothetical protein